MTHEEFAAIGWTYIGDCQPCKMKGNIYRQYTNPNYPDITIKVIGNQFKTFKGHQLLFKLRNLSQLQQTLNEII